MGITIRSQDYGIYSEVGYLQSPDLGQTWLSYRQIAINGTSFQGVSTLRPYTFGADEIHLTWHDPRRMHQWSSDGGKTWSTPVEIMPLGAAFGGPNELAKDSAGNLHAILATGGGVWSGIWSGNAWRNFQPIDNRAIDPHGQHLVVCQGNQLHAVYYDRTGPNKVWYSTKTVVAPHIARVAFSTSESDQIPKHERAGVAQGATQVPRPVTAAEFKPVVANKQQSASFEAIPAVLLGVIPSAILVLTVLLVTLSKRRR